MVPEAVVERLKLSMSGKATQRSRFLAPHIGDFRRKAPSSPLRLRASVRGRGGHGAGRIEFEVGWTSSDSVATHLSCRDLSWVRVAAVSSAMARGGNHVLEKRARFDALDLLDLAGAARSAP